MKSIKDQIKENSIHGAYLLYGEEDFLKDYYSNRIVELCTAEGPVEFNYMKINSEKPDNDAITEFIISMPFMSDKKILLLKNTGIFSKASDTVKKFWVDTLSNLPDYMVIVFCEASIDKRSAIYKAIDKNHTAEEFPLSKENELINWFARILASHGKSMTKDDISFVIENVGRNMYLLKNEAEKLVSYTANDDGVIPRSYIEESICKSLEGKVFDLIDNIISGNKAKAINQIKDLKTLREQPIMIIALIFRQFSILRRIKISEGAPIYEIAQKTKQRDFVIKKNLNQLKKYSLADLDNAIILCNKADEDIKAGRVEPWLTVEKLAISLMSMQG